MIHPVAGTQTGRLPYYMIDLSVLAVPFLAVWGTRPHHADGPRGAFGRFEYRPGWSNRLLGRSGYATCYDCGSMDAVQISNVTKTFGAVTAVDDLSLTVPEGSVYGFIGPNGSGKTTTMRMIASIFYPDRGDVRVFGKQMLGARSELIGYLPEERGLYRKMPCSRSWSSTESCAAAARSPPKWKAGSRSSIWRSGPRRKCRRLAKA